VRIESDTKYIFSLSLQILLPYHFKLVEPSLTTQQKLTGSMVKTIFHQKCLFVRPDRVLLEEPQKTVSQWYYFLF